MLKIFLTILMFVLSVSSTYAHDFSKRDIRYLEALISDVKYIVDLSGLFNKNIDVINNPATNNEMLLFSLLYMDLAERDKFHEISPEERKKFDIDEYYRVGIPLVELKNTAKKIFDYDLDIDTKFKHEWFIIKNNQLYFFGASESGMYPELVIKEIKKDAYGLIRISCEYEDENTREIFKYAVTVRDNSTKELKQHYQLLQIKVDK
ncbi:MAG: hypothetical protein IJU79_00145 [Desulfovibrionaceae bacterium]|nr:hypothetical protein [Desulfovibrionaceae bacterium]